MLKSIFCSSNVVDTQSDAAGSYTTRARDAFCLIGNFPDVVGYFIYRKFGRTVVCSDENSDVSVRVSNGEAGDLRRHHAQYDVIVMRTGLRHISYDVILDIMYVTHVKSEYWRYN